jgi:hypothetical protein
VLVGVQDEGWNPLVFKATGWADHAGFVSDHDVTPLVPVFSVDVNYSFRTDNGVMGLFLVPVNDFDLSWGKR